MQLTPKLNYDILLEVMKACPRDDCARLMQTCSSLRNNGHKVLLSHPLQFYAEKDILRFLQYLQPQSDRRAKHVRSMHFYMGAVELSESTALALAAALPVMHGIQELSITDSEYFMSSHPVLSRATGALTSLRSLHLTDMGEFAVKMLRSLRSELTDVLLDYNVETLLYGSQEELVGLSELLAHSQATLQEIAINRWYALPDTWESGELGVAFPETRRLIIGQSLYPPFALSYTCAFPALSHLSVRTGESEMYDAEDVREWNISQLARDPGCAWKALEDLDGNLVEIYALALPCTVERVHLGEITPDHLFMLGPALSDARPRHLRMDKWPIGRPQGPTSDLFAALRGHGGSRLETLAMEVGLSKSDSDIDLAAVLEELFSALAAGAPLQELRLNVRLGKVDPRPMKAITHPVPKRSRRRRGDPLPDIKEYPLTVAEQSLVNFDARDYLCQFTAAVPKLRIVKMTFGGVRGLRKVITLADGEIHVDGSW